MGKPSKSFCKRLLKGTGKYVTVKGTPKENPDDLLALKKIIEAGKLKTVIDRRYKPEQIREAHAYAEQFHKRGNVVVNVFDEARK